MDTARVAALAAEPGPAAARGPDAVVLVLPLALIAAAVLVVLYRRRHGPHSPPYRTVPELWDGVPTAPPARAAQDRATATRTLDSRARAWLLRLDDAVLRRREQVRAARAQAGDAAVGPHVAAVEDAAGEAARALRLWHRLDDPALRRNEPERRKLLQDITDRCSAALGRLAAVGGSLAAARGLPADAEGALAAARERQRALGERVRRAEEVCDRLGRDYAPAALAPVRGHPEAAAERSAMADDLLSAAGRAVEAGDRRRAADAIQDAEAAIGQAEVLADGVDRWRDELARADTALAEAVRVTQGDVLAAPGLPPVREDSGRAEAALAAVGEDLAPGRRDPFGGLRRLADGGTPLAHALAPGRDRGTRNRRARVLLDEALLTATAELGAARDLVTTHRGEVGSEARAKLAEAAHRLARARALAPHDAATALPFAWHADALAREARVAASRDAGALA
ncbi:hypothetical protein [Streptomyces marincola]|uniref:TPM domain-containing protein n=1 Tax=Streptomyces marincola TaxID=2878388 RepID=A0A1W7CVM7_9ACTN|nr:hypothetical protein [Streptomyces marincola]ARQ68787.1 hypothetical protein CAG99_07875 [Streptomyces marincola]